MRKAGRVVVAALLSACGLVISGHAFAQMADSDKPKVELHGNVTVGVGVVDWGESNGATGAGKASSELFEADEVQLRADVKVNEQLTAFADFRLWDLNSANANSQGAAPGGVGNGAPFKTVGSTVFAEVHWKPTDSVEIAAGNFDYPLWAGPMTQEAVLFPSPVAYYLIPNHSVPTAQGGVSVFIQEQMFSWNGIHGVDFNYTAGGIQYGLALSPQCTGLAISSCQNANQSTMSIVPHIFGKLGDLTFNGQVDSVSGTIANDTSTTTYQASSLGWAAGLAYAPNPDLRFAADVSNWDIAKISALGQDTDQVYSNLGARADFSRLMLQYWQTEYNPLFVKKENTATFGAPTVTNSVWTIRYTIPTQSKVVLMPEIKSETLGKQGLTAAGKPEDITNTQVDVIARVAF